MEALLSCFSSCFRANSKVGPTSASAVLPLPPTSIPSVSSHVEDTLSARQWVPSEGTHFPHLFGEWEVAYEEKQREKHETNKE